MPSRPIDSVTSELVGAAGQSGVIDRFTSVEVIADLTAPSEASFELGDDGSWQSGASGSVRPGRIYRVTVNGLPVMAGRVEANDAPLDGQAGAVVRFTVRTKLSDAFFASADPKVSVKGTTLDLFLRELYGPLGVELDVRADLQRDLLTGQPSKPRGGQQQIRLERLKVEEARVRPPETIYAAADRHLRRFGLMQWDGADGRVVIGYPDTDQDPTYFFHASRRSPRLNNVLAATRAQDYSGVPSEVNVHGFGSQRDFSRARISATVVEPEVSDAGFVRPLFLPAESARNAEAAFNAAERELSSRRRNMDSVVVEVDGLSQWQGRRLVNFAVNTTASYASDVAGLQGGRYYLHRVVLRRDAMRGDTANLTMVRQGLWRLFPEAYQGKLSG